MKLTAPRLALMAMAGTMASAAPLKAADDVVIVYDASGSMWGQIDGTSKMEIARDVLGDLVDNWDESTNLGLVAYGHRSQGDCTDIETLIAPGPLDKASFIDTVGNIKPVGKTPISAAVQRAADLMSYRDNPATVVLISDGVETCNADPCALSAGLAKQGVKFTAHVVGFDLKKDENANLSCIAENTGGMFVSARNAAELNDALTQVTEKIEEVPSTTPDPEPDLPEVTLTGPEQVTTGAVFDFSWSGSINGRDFITIVPTGADEGTANDYIRVKDASEGRLTAPGTPGLYELRYALEQGRRTLASAPVEVVEAEVTLTGPEQVTTGAIFDFSWSGSINGRDFITIVPAGADEGTANDYIRVKDAREGRLTAPGTPGLYELRYALEQGRRTLASVPVEVVEAEVTLTGPEQVTTGAIFDFSWSGSINGRDFITIVPAGADEGTANDYIRVKDASEGRLTAPGTPGLYELRYALEQGRRTLASAPVEVVEAEVGIAGPGTVRAKSDVDVSWSGSINGRDFVTIVPMGADEGTANDYIRVKEASEGRLTAPDTPGLYELRYVLEQGRRTLASAPLEVVGADAPLDDGAGLSVPETAAPGATIKVTWTGESDSTDQRIALARKDQPDFSWISVQKVGVEKALDLTMPDEAGLYEVRFLDVSDHELLGRSIVEVK
ncbi:von Willebrand factor type A domain protein [Roseovarius sp. A-2]|uniref:vWA domain-containing protein n=1 Tax=Roseovarius sp. A-2 TaxID=1570360 RepID=UPI0009C489BF|nr:VWA domain-containing protein [Roseovarius sp. A-2]GAW36256.1 von Willebrand factor type A domain protein [Roseovarius sp. A-2]